MTDIGNKTTNTEVENREPTVSFLEGAVDNLEKSVTCLDYDHEINESSDHNRENDSDSSENDSSENEEGDVLSTLIQPLSFTENSELYVVSVDGLPKFYVKDIKAAHEKMWNIARQLASCRFLGGYNTNFLKIGENELHLIGSFRFFVIAYDTTLNRITCSRVQECV